MSKAVRVASALDAELELFHCVFDAEIARPGRFGSRGVQSDIREIVTQRHQQLERNAERLRAKPPGFRAPVSRRSAHRVYPNAARPGKFIL